jgi:FkbM family methyltransferase
MSSWVDVDAARAIVWRLGRRLYCAARRDVANDPKHNGEYWLVDQVMGGARDTAIALDIGANRGDWSARVSAALARAGRNGHVIAFEPTESTWSHLRDRFAGDATVETIRAALSDRSSQGELYVVGDLEGTNSLHFLPGARRERVRVSTVDQFLQERSISEVALVKTDTEGHDLSVLRGAVGTLRDGRVELWQFEYNHRWIANRAFLKDVFDTVEGLPYRLGRLYGDGIELYPEWHPELERFFEGNYVLLRRGCPLEVDCRTMHFGPHNVLEPA